MTFLRIKKIKGKEYCYVVENKWKKAKGARQQVKGYLGRVVRLKGKDIDFFDYYDSDEERFFKGKDSDAILRALVLWELAKAGFVEEGKKMAHGLITADKKTLKISNGGKKVVLALNEGHLCDFTLRKIKRFRKTGDLEEDSVDLARMFVDAGLAVPAEVLIGFYQKVKKVADV